MWWKKPLPTALTIVLIWTVCRLIFLSYTGSPLPHIQDEFSYLLGADTFAHGRLANPAHPLGEFFESPQIMVRPVYASTSPPGQALFLALGQRVFGDAFYGVVLGNALMLFTFCLMLFAWVPWQWALAVSGTIALCLQPGMYWTNSYGGGSVAASGGALLLLGIGVYRKKQMPVAGAVFALGTLLLFWTRPLEGGVFALVVLVVFAGELWHKQRARAVIAACLVLVPGFVWTCYQNRAVTGSPLPLSYLVADRQNDLTPAFSFSPPNALFDSPRIFELTPGMAILFTLLIPVAWRNSVYRKMAIITGVFLLVLTAKTFHMEHDAAPVWAALALMIAVWAERAWKLKVPGLPVGVALVVLALVSPVFSTLPAALSLLRPATVAAAAGNTGVARSWTRQRAALIARLSNQGARQLVIVRYPSPTWEIEQEWVYNSADIDGQQVIFAHDLGAQRNAALLGYYANREASLLTFDPQSGQERIAPYRSEFSIVASSH